MGARGILFVFLTCFCGVLTKKPNFVWIFADDLGFNDVGFRNPEIRTPNIDKLVEDGLLFNNAYTNHLCSPSRSAFLSGKHPYKTAMQHGVLMFSSPDCLGLENKLLPEYLRDLGYSTHAYGKWHLGYCLRECLPTNRGFDTFSGGYLGEAGYFNHTTMTPDTNGRRYYDWHRGEEPYRDVDGVHSEEVIEKNVLETLENYDGNNPLFLYVAFHSAHIPLEARKEYYELYEDLEGADDNRKNYLGKGLNIKASFEWHLYRVGLVSGMDAVIGNIVDKLKEIGEYENTYTIFSSDNGGYAFASDNSPYRGGKASLWEGGCRATSFIHSPLLKSRGTHDGILHLVDWMPTIIDMAGGSVPKEEKVDGWVQTEMVTNNGESKRNFVIYNIDRYREPKYGEMAARNGKYKLIWGFPGKQDGYGLNQKFIYDMEEYKSAAEEYYRSRTKRSNGPYSLTDEEKFSLLKYMESVQVTEENLEKGTGSMKLFDLHRDPEEREDLSNSTDQEHVAAKEELIKLLQDAVNNDYVGPKEKYKKHSPIFEEEEARRAVMTPGWCEGLFP